MVLFLSVTRAVWADFPEFIANICFTIFGITSVACSGIAWLFIKKACNRSDLVLVVISFALFVFCVLSAAFIILRPDLKWSNI